MTGQNQKIALDKRIRSGKKSVCSVDDDCVVVSRKRCEMMPAIAGAGENDSTTFAFDFLIETLRCELESLMRRKCDDPEPSR